ncbi:ATP-binding cassette domain-containing protein [Synechococcus elongatus]|uniref:ATP-binding cassette domain-containing protein n=1 Tax=Synechococcus elongatus PCC 11801 TaxID=2219813 RepID=A0AAQ3MC50_SYNEL
MTRQTEGTRIDLLGLTKAYAGRPVLQQLELTIAAGSFVAVIGRSGCGKSTLLRLISGLEQASAGGILIDGQPLKGLNRLARVMFQDGRLLPWKNVINNVGLGLKGNWKPRAEQVLKQVGLLERSQEWTARLSGGQKQRVALAKALITQPKLLLLDEPLGALDALTRVEMQRLIEGLWLDQGFTTLLVTHDVEEAVALADRILVLEDGGVVRDIPIQLPRPRHRGNPEFARLAEDILEGILSGNNPPQRSAIAPTLSHPALEIELTA